MYFFVPGPAECNGFSWLFTSKTLCGLGGKGKAQAAFSVVVRKGNAKAISKYVYLLKCVCAHRRATLARRDKSLAVVTLL